MRDHYNLEKLIKILPVLARTAGGYATITDSEGRRLCTFDWNGTEIKDLDNQIYDLARNAGQQACPLIGVSQIVDQADAWALPIGEYVLACSNVERLIKEQKFQDALIKALPMIAQVAGGEAVIFNDLGERLLSYYSNGSERHQLKGQVSKQARQAMVSQEPVVGKSFSINGAMAVRIPITEKIGFGFNNENAVRQHQKLYDEVKKFQNAKYCFEDIIGESEVLTKTKSMAKFVADGVSSILIYGETGTGKELFAQSIHNASDRRYRSFVALNCGALPASLIESNLFGYEEGAFTGAKKGGSPGAFEQANGGTIFLDEISEMDISLQTKLLRVLQEREVVRVGGFKAQKIDVRVIASTNKELNDLIADGGFRQDLFYRLNVVQLKIPPLRERVGDIGLLAKHFMHKFSFSFGRLVEDIDPRTLKLLQNHAWPGNVRELQNCIESAMNMVREESTLLPEHLPLYLRQGQKTLKESVIVEIGNEELNLKEALSGAEKLIIQKALEMAKFKKVKAARILGISTATLWRKLTEYGMEGDNQ
ncbi:sigma-54 interacting regulator [Desulfosporosinus orientis DSM 765]|uniref:Sigma-54 interacting regulator n=1 Tax=Desulfosporosinus orientis (strain ATCC 19365 / DSM 765 / NCIMB 8382 / VKM B-1628 / Singapore I) TaxID=768706 RepID=G7W7T1_DESOD|nr:sigma 54-interacting transcriptional regulator [Desulfosporosinus orientis]AET66146.1 sigma-54 interacting regulator [Desulfosporosinus orientis DSM 765]